MIDETSRLQSLVRDFRVLSWPWRIAWCLGGYIVLLLAITLALLPFASLGASWAEMVQNMLTAQLGPLMFVGFVWLSYWIVPQLLPKSLPCVVRWVLIAFAPPVFLVMSLVGLKDYETFG